MIQRVLDGSTELSGEQLLSSSIAAWVTYVLIFSLLYWQIIAAAPKPGCVTRAQSRTGSSQEDASEEQVSPGWYASYVDYLFLSFSTATAFSTTDVVPMKSRAKLFMMLQAAISLVTITAVASRAINILGVAGGVAEGHRHRPAHTAAAGGSCSTCAGTPGRPP